MAPLMWDTVEDTRTLASDTSHKDFKTAPFVILFFIVTLFIVFSIGCTCKIVNRRLKPGDLQRQTDRVADMNKAAGSRRQNDIISISGGDIYSQESTESSLRFNSSDK